jgi:hypothetical protein
MPNGMGDERATRERHEHTKQYGPKSREVE